MDVEGWLQSLGLEQYAAAFRDNAIDEAILPRLTPEDLKDLGVVSVGHRRKLLDAIAALRADNKPKSQSAELVSADGGSPESTAERRQVTVMFSDLVGSTALSARMDPEDLREVIAAYQKCVVEIVTRFGGFIAKYMGDGVLLYFGYPQAHEDDAERAVRAGLEMTAAVQALKTHVQLQSRIGIATGLVVVGDLIGSGQAQERGIVGETPNLAARLQGVAEPNMVVIADDTRKLVGDLFEFKDLGAHELKGIAIPVQAWAPLRPSTVESRFDALHAAGLTELVGREEEIELILRRWSRAKRGEGQVVLLSGEAGIGKSRLTAALLDRLNAEPHTRLRYFCSPQHIDSALYPIIGQIERAAGFTHDDTSLAKLDKLDALLALSSTSMEDAALFAEMLSLPNDGRYPAVNLTPAQKRQRTMEALDARLASLSGEKPVFMIFEDAHWTDPTTLEAFGRTVDRVAKLRALLIVTSRPEFEPPWIGRPHVSSLTINRLTQADSDAIIDRVAGDRMLPANIRQDIIDRTDGIPLFVEEMTKAVLEAGGGSVGRSIAAAAPLPALAVPSSLHASLMARLDRLGSAKELAQIGAAIGREFPHGLLAAVAAKPEAELRSALDRLIAAGLLFRQGLPPHATYLFKHALVQDAAYGTLLRELRRALHTRIANALESQFTEVVDGHPELLARHLTEAGQIEKAAALWGKAGRLSLARSALKEAAEQLTRALGQIATLPSTAALRRDEIKLQIDLSNALIHVKGHASSETKASFERARSLIEQAEALGEPADDPLVLFSVLYGFWVGNRMAFKGDVACELAGQFLSLAQKESSTIPRMIGHMMLGISLVLVGDIEGGRTHLDRVFELYDPAEHRRLATRFGHDVRMTASSWRALASWMLGYPDAASTDIENALKDARDMEHAATSMFALSHTALARVLCRDRAAARVLADQLVALAEAKGSLYWKSYGMMLQGWILADGGNASDALPLTVGATTAIRSTGAMAYAPWYLTNLAHAYAQVGEFEEARRRIAEATTAAETTGERWCESDIHRTAGEVALMSSDPTMESAVAHFERALSVARLQKAKSFELRAALAMARLWRDQGKPAEARELLAPIYGWFTEGYETLDLKEARALLDTPMSEPVE